jgi:CheY-like chemotaxis protein/transcriptional regulator with GAF, ATPase, and Fis domain
MASLLQAFFRHITQGRIDDFLAEVKTLASDSQRQGLPFKNVAAWFYLFETSSRPVIEQEMPDVNERARARASVSQLMHIAATTFAQAALEEQTRTVESQAQMLQARHRILMALACESEIPALCARVADELHQLIAGDRVSLTLLNDRGEKLHEYAVEASDRLSWLLTATRSHRLTASGSTAADRESVVSVPLIWQGDLMGLLKVSKSRAAVFTQDDLELAHFVAQHLAQTVARARAHARRWLRPEQSEALRQMALATSRSEPAPQVLQKIVHALTPMLGAQASLLFFFDEQWSTWFRPIGFGLSDEQIQEWQDALLEFTATADLLSIKMPISLHDATRDPRLPKTYVQQYNIKSALVVPLVINDVPVGMMALTWTGITRAVDQEELNLARHLAQLLAVVAENGRLRESAPREPPPAVIQAERTEALEQLALALRHEINNPLTGILGNAQLLLLTPNLPEDLRSRLETIEALTLRIRDIVRRLETVRDQTVHYLDERRMIDLQAGSASQAEARRVLVVDDEASIVTLLTTLLTKEGFEVESASSGASALKQIASGAFDHILLDIKMPDMDGQQVYRQLRQTRPDVISKIIFITGDASSPETLEFILQTGNKYLKKPFTLQEIKSVLIPFLKNDALG